MRRLLVLLCMPLLVLFFNATSAQAAEHFIKSASSSSLDGSSLVVNFKEAGLPSGATETITVSVTESITYECVNNGGKNPAASNKKTFVTTDSTSGEFTADRNGNIVGSLTLAPLSAAEVGFSCPPGQTVTLVSVSYTNVTVTDEDTGASIKLANQSFTNPDAPPVR